MHSRRLRNALDHSRQDATPTAAAPAPGTVEVGPGPLPPGTADPPTRPASPLRPPTRAHVVYPAPPRAWRPAPPAMPMDRVPPRPAAAAAAAGAHPLEPTAAEMAQAFTPRVHGPPTPAAQATIDAVQGWYAARGIPRGAHLTPEQIQDLLAEIRRARRER